MSEVSCAPTARPTASLATPHLVQILAHKGSAVGTRLIVSFLEALQVRIKATMAESACAR